MKIGDLNKRISFEAQSKSSDGMGGQTVAWVSVASSIPAAIWPVSANETIKSMQVVMTISHRIRIRYRSVMKPDWRISYAGRYFDIVSIVDPQEEHRWLDIMCKASA